MSLVDELLPPEWDKQGDIIVLAGAGCSALTHQLIARGQERVLAFSKNAGERDACLAAGAFGAVDAVSAVNDALLLIAGDLPRRVTTQRVGPDIGDEEMTELSRVVAECVETMVIQRNTMIQFGPRWVKQVIENMPHVAKHPDITALKDAFKGMPCVIVSPGPSLDKNIHLLEQIHDYAFIIAGSHALSSLKKVGVVPDVVVVSDAQDLSYHFKDYPVDKIGALVLAASSFPALYSLPNPRIFTAATNGACESWVYGDLKAELANGGSVSCAAFTLALEFLGCTTLILVGQDLSFAPDGKYYASSNADAAQSVVLKDGGYAVAGMSEGMANIAYTHRDPASYPSSMVLRKLPGYHGGEVNTSSQFALYHRWFEMMAKTHGERARMVNCTEGGAKIAGMEQMTLAEMFAELDGGEIADPCRRPMKQPYDSASGLKTMQKRISSYLSALELCEHKLGQCQMWLAESRANSALLVQLTESDIELVGVLNGVPFMSLLCQRAILKLIYQGRRCTTVDASLRAAEEFYHLVRQSIELVKPMLKDAMGRL